MEKINKEDLLTLHPFKANDYNSLSLTSLTAYSVFWLAQWGITTTLENISVINHRLFPEKFSMVGWAQFPDLNRTNRSVLQMRPKYRNFASSASDKGVFLNDNGLQEAYSLIKKFGNPAFKNKKDFSPVLEIKQTQKDGKRSRSVHPEDVVLRIRNSKLFMLYKDNMFFETEAIHLIGLLGVYDHTPSKEKKRKLRELLDYANEIEDKEIVDFLKLVENKFDRYLNK
jgi:hypothetical protein